MSEIKYERITWSQLERDCLELYKKIKNVQFDRIVSISRGGSVVARILSDLMGNLPISHITITSYKDLKKGKQIVIAEEPQADFKNKTILIVDEVSDTGNSFEVAHKYFQKKSTKKIYTITPYIKPHTKFKTDFWTRSIDAWIIFPYELQETATAFLKMFGTKEHAKARLLKVGIEQWQIDYLL